MGKRKNRGLRRAARVLLVLFLLFAGLILWIRSPWGQNIIVSKLTGYISDKTHTKVTIDRLFLTFSGNLLLEGLYLEDQKGDTLIYSRALEADLSLPPILFGNELHLRSLRWEGLRANVLRSNGSEKFNFDFILEALVPQDTVQVTEPSDPMGIDIGSLRFKDFKIVYSDAFLGMESQVRLGELAVDMDGIDLETLKFELDDLKLSDTEIRYEQTKTFAEGDTTKGRLPFLTVDRFVLQNVTARYRSAPDSITANMAIGNFLLEMPKADLSKNDIDIGLLSLKDSQIAMELPAKIEEKDTVALSGGEGFPWPRFRVQIAEIDLSNNTVNYTMGQNTAPPGVFNPNAIGVSGIVLQANDLEYRPEKVRLKVGAFSFAEKSGFRLRDLAFEADLEDTSASLSKLRLQTNSSRVSGNMVLTYPSVQKFMESPGMATINLQLPRVEVNVGDAYFFRPELAENSYVKQASLHPFTGKMEVNGTLDALEIADFGLYWGEHTFVLGKGRLNDLTQTDSLSFVLNDVRANTSRDDVLKFVREDELGISVPRSMVMALTAQGNVNDMEADVRLRMPEGSIRVAGNYKNGEQRFDGNVKVDSLQMGKLLGNEALGGISFTMDIAGGGKSLNTLDAGIITDFSELTLNNYDFSDLELTAHIVGGKGSIDLAFADENLQLSANTHVVLDSLASQLRLHLNLAGADLYALGATKERIRAGLEMTAEYKGDPDDYALDVLVNNGIAVYDGAQYHTGKIDLRMLMDSVHTEASINSDFLKGSLRSNASLKRIDSALTQKIKRYFTEDSVNPVTTDSVQLHLDMGFRPIPILTDVFLRDLEQMDSVLVQAHFDASTDVLGAKLLVPSVKYAGSTVDSLSLHINGNANDLDITAGFAGLVSEPVHMERTYLKGNLKNRELLLDFASYSGVEEIAHISSGITLAKDTVQVHIDPDGLRFHREEWTIPKDNGISMAKDFLAFKNLKIGRRAQELTVTHTMDGMEKEHIAVSFDNFRMQTFLSLLNPNEALASGLMNGDLTIENPFGATGIVADFKITDLEVLKNALGNLSVKANSTGSSAYDFKLSLKDGGADLDLQGDYAAATSGALLNLDLDLNRIDLTMLEGFSGGSIKDAQGFISGKIDLSGTATAPEYSGSISFNASTFNVSALNSVFRISDESVRVDTEGLYLNDFKISDVDGNSFTIKGSVLTRELTDPTFDLALVAQDFKILDSTKEDNGLFYGTASLNTDLTIKGNLKLPRINGKLGLGKTTQVTYVVPEDQLDVEERDGVVVFVNRENPNDILTRSDQEETPAFFQGMDVNAILEIPQEAVFNIIIDERTGDNLKVSGDAALNLIIQENGRINLSGRYELNSGHYETNLYNLVKRRFEINPGSTITWQGEPTDAKLNVTAVYHVETSASPLMASVTSGQNVAAADKYRQVLPFMVYLNVDGELLAPKLSFGLDMPEDEKGSLGGAVYTKVQQLNQQEAELNKQVFSLLALNRFFPDSGSDGSAGGTAAIARDNVNRVLSGELNAFSDKVFGNSGFEVDFDLDSFTDYQGDGPQDRTQLNINARKKLFDDRLIVTAGSAVDVEGSAQAGQGETPIIGNVSLEYLLTENGQYRLKGFRKSEYQNIIDGQLIVTGVALIFNREFNKFSQLFKPSSQDEDSKKENGGGKKKE